MLLKGRLVIHAWLMLAACGASTFYYVVFMKADVAAPKEVIIADYACHRPAKIEPVLSKYKCKKLNRILVEESKKKLPDEYVLIRNSAELQKCMWKPNQKKIEYYRSEMRKCCNASYQLLVTQENTAIGQEIFYELQKKKSINVTKEMFNIFPKTSPFSGKRYKTCAVVGSGSILLGSCCGREIDQAEFVFRFNLATLNYTTDVGTKVDVITANPSILVKSFQSLNARRKAFADLLKSYRGALILMSAFTYTWTTQMSMKLQYTIDDFGLESKMVAFHPLYLQKLALYWKTKGLLGVRLSSGFMVISAALELCDRVTLYGFWPFSTDPEGKPLNYHYYDQLEFRKKDVHCMPKEFLIFNEMYHQGALRLKLGKCF